MAGPGFDPRLTVGQLNVPPGAQCTTPWGPLRSSELAGVARVTGDREIAYTSLFARLVLKGYVKVKHKELRAAERAIVRYPVRRQRRGVSRRPRPGGRVPVDRARRDRGRASSVANRTPLPGEVAFRRAGQELPRELLGHAREARGGDAAPVVARPPQPGSGDPGTGPVRRLPHPGTSLHDSEDERRSGPRPSARADCAARRILDPECHGSDPGGARADLPGRGLRQLAHAPGIERASSDHVPPRLAAGRWSDGAPDRASLPRAR